MQSQPAFTFRTILLNFGSWIVYGILAATGRLGAGYVGGFIVSLWQAIAKWRKSERVNVMDWVTMIFFFAGAVSTAALHSAFFPHYGNALVWCTLTVIAWGSLLIGAPFTSEYARDFVPENLWTTPGFRRVNAVVTAAWGSVFLINAAIDLVLESNSNLMTDSWFKYLPYLGIACGIVFTNRYPQWARQRAQASTKGEADRTIAMAEAHEPTVK